MKPKNPKKLMDSGNLNDNLLILQASSLIVIEEVQPMLTQKNIADACVFKFCRFILCKPLL